MSDIHNSNDVNQAGTTIFCQNCGKRLAAGDVRQVGQSVFCEPCLEARVAGAPAGYGASGYANPNYGPVNTGIPYGQPGWVAGVPLPAQGPNPGLAALLGFIPGVGAMYNEQYAKGIIHLIVFAVLVTLASDVNGIFGLFIAGWEFYMAIEAHHTAKARLDGTPLPNPFGLNDIGERLGFGKSWPGGANVAGAAQDAARAASTAWASGVPPRAAGYQPVTPPPPAASAGWGAPVDAYAQEAGAQPFHGDFQPYAAPYAQPTAQDVYEQARRDSFGAVPPVYPGYGAPVPPMPPMPPLKNRFPAGAVWLIGLGVFFLLGTTRLFDHFNPGVLVGAGLIGLAVWMFVRKMTETGQSLSADGTPQYTVRVLCALRGGVWVGLVGILILLNSLDWLRWHSTWPWFIILAGVMTLLERGAYNKAAAPAYAPYGVPPVAQPVAEGAPAVAVSEAHEVHEGTDTPKGGL